MCARISPTCSSTSVSIDCSPERIRVRAARTQTGQSESVVRGHPNPGAVRCRLLSSGAGAHFGWKAPSANCRFTAWNTGHASLAAPVTAISSGFHTFIRTYLLRPLLGRRPIAPGVERREGVSERRL
jgi:hypothetical protein